MIDTIVAFFNWVTNILTMWLRTEIVDGYTFYDIYMFLFLSGVFVSFILYKIRTYRRNDKSE